jgi:hypothetical protein
VARLNAGLFFFCRFPAETEVKSGFPTMSNSLLPNDLSVLLFPAGLFVFYVVSWFLVGRDPRIRNIVPQYEPPPGISPGVARYIMTGGSDGTTLASVVSGMAAKGVISIQPAQKTYQLELLDSKISVWPEEAALAKMLFHTDLPTLPYSNGRTAIVGSPDLATLDAGQGVRASLSDDIAAMSLIQAVASAGPARSQAVIDPALAGELKIHVDTIQDTFRKNLQGVYFRQNFGFAGIGMLATLVWALVTAASIKTQSSMFITFWLLMFTSLAGLVLGGVMTSRPTQPTFSQKIGRFLFPLIFFGAPGALIYFVALPHSHAFVIALLLAVVFNNVFFVLMRAPTAQGRIALQQLAGFKEFLLRVEQDRLDRVNSPAERAQLMNRFLPYAIALGVKEGWGDTMAAALSNAIVER